MTLVNTDGLTFIGPGSEWFWTAVSGIVLASTFIAIYRQLRLQRNTAALQTIDSLRREWYSERMARARLEILVSLHKGADTASFGNEGCDIANFWEGVGYLVRAGSMDRRLVYEVFGLVVVQWWAWLAPTAQTWRQRQASRTVWENFEWLAGQIEATARRAGVRPSDGVSRRAHLLSTYIDDERHAIRLAEELRAVIVRPADIATVRQPAETPPHIQTDVVDVKRDAGSPVSTSADIVPQRPMRARD